MILLGDKDGCLDILFFTNEVKLFFLDLPKHTPESIISIIDHNMVLCYFMK